jgi:hypothetical protein
VTLKTTLTQCGNNASKCGSTYLAVKHRRITARRGRKIANVAVGRTILELIYYMILNGSVFDELGAEFYETRDKEKIVRSHVKKLENSVIQ